MIDAHCNKCRFTFTFTTLRERTNWLGRHPRDHKVENIREASR